MTIRTFLYRLPRAVAQSKWTQAVNVDDEVMGIPANLSWERICGGPGCKLSKTRDFMNYLHYVEHSAENFKFYLWYQDYCKRFERLSPAQKDLSPPFEESKPVVKARSPTSPTHIDDGAGSAGRHQRRTDSTAETLVGHELSRLRSVDVGPDLFKLQQSQPFRAELTRVTSMFLTPGTNSPLELNLDDRDRLSCLRGLSQTTHPSALKPALRAAELCLRLQSHPNYCRRKISNSRKERATFMLMIAVLFYLAGIAGALLLILSGKPRAWRVFPALILGLGTLQIFGYRRQFCVQYWGFGYLRSLEPWEKSDYNALTRINTISSTHNPPPSRRSRFARYESQSSTSSVVGIKDPDGAESTITTSTRTDINSTKASHIGSSKNSAMTSSLFTLESGRTEEDEEEVYVRVFHERSYLSKMFENGIKEVDPEIRRLQLVIGSQLIAIGAGTMGVLCAILLPIPRFGLM